MTWGCRQSAKGAAESLTKHGFAVVKDVAVHLLEPGHRIYVESGFATHEGFRSSARDSLSTDRVRLDRLVKALLAPLIDAVLGPRRTFLGGVLHKGRDGEIEFHQDLTYTDERAHRSMTCWMPLVDVGELNGAMRLVPESHHWTTGIRPAGPGGGYVKHDLEPEFGRRAVDVPMRAGSILIWDNAILHGSPPNSSHEPRAALAITFTDPGAELLIFHAESSGEMTGYRIDDRYLAQTSPFKRPPTGYQLVAPWTTRIDEHSFEKGLLTSSSPVS